MSEVEFVSDNIEISFLTTEMRWKQASLGYVTTRYSLACGRVTAFEFVFLPCPLTVLPTEGTFMLLEGGSGVVTRAKLMRHNGPMLVYSAEVGSGQWVDNDKKTATPALSASNFVHSAVARLQFGEESE